MSGRATAVGEPLWDCQLPQFTHAAVTMLRSWRSTRSSHRDRLLRRSRSDVTLTDAGGPQGYCGPMCSLFSSQLASWSAII